MQVGKLGDSLAILLPVAWSTDGNPEPMPSGPLAVLGLQLAAQYQLALDDALTAAAVLDAGCATQLSENMHCALVIDGQPRAHDPFRVA